MIIVNYVDNLMDLLDLNVKFFVVVVFLRSNHEAQKTCRQ